MRSDPTFIAIMMGVIMLSALWPAEARETKRQPLQRQPYGAELGRRSGAVAAGIEHVHRQVIEYAGTSLMQLHFGEYRLGEGSFLTVISLADGGLQRLDAAGIESWFGSSAMFNGDAVEIELHSAAGDDDAFVVVESVSVSDPPDHQIVRAQGAVASICNDGDNRGNSNDSRVARLSTMGFWPGGCTAWLISNGAVLTAGHCGDPDGDLTGAYIEFSVPPSMSDGRSVAADPSDQYPVSNGAYHWYASNGEGDDYQVFVVSTNSTTGLRAHIQQGFFRLSDSSPAADTTLRVTGFGLDNIPAGSAGSSALCCDASNDDVCEYDCNSDSVTQQTSTGRLDAIGGGVVEHEVDTMPANSGSPVIWESNGLALGIHTTGGCDEFFSDYDNAGTAFSHGTLAARINDYRGSNAIYVDVARNITLPTGTVFRPWKTVALGAAVVPDGGVVSIVEGTYPASDGNTFIAGDDGKAMTLEAPVGMVTIGN
jgi:V8-like Glu-specific endopeptidase